jgi:hypothetical protein
MAGTRIIIDSATDVLLNASGAGNRYFFPLYAVVVQSNQRLRIERIDVAISGTSTDQPLRLVVCTSSTAGGSTTNSALTPTLVNPSDTETVQTTATQYTVCSACTNTAPAGVKESLLLPINTARTERYFAGKEIMLPAGTYYFGVQAGNVLTAAARARCVIIAEE